MEDRIQKERSPQTLRYSVGALIAGLGLWLLKATVDLSLHKRFSVDEFEYVHGAWLIARGEVIYRDFFEAHFPLVNQLMAIPWLFLEDDPTNILYIRVAFLPVFLSIVGSAWWINSRKDRLTGLLTPLMILATAALVGMGIEVRPDTTAFAFFLAGVAVLHAKPRISQIKGITAGFLIALSVWGSQKVVYYALPILAAFILESIQTRQRSRNGLLGGFGAFTTGAAISVSGIATYLTVTNSWSDWFKWGVQWSFTHQLHYPPFPWTQNFLPLFSLHTWLFVFGSIGVFQACRERLGSAKDEGVHPDLLLLGLLVSTLASAAWQTAPFLYSFVPFLTILAIFAARGLTATLRRLTQIRATRPATGLFLMLLGGLLICGELLHVRTIVHRELALDNSKQIATLQRVGELTRPGDAVFDIAGKRVARPGIHYFFFTDAVIRKTETVALAKEFPAGILENECSVYLHDDRFSSFPAELRLFLLSNFQPMTDEIWLWGRRYPSGSETSSDAAFFAVKTGAYFVHPPQALAEGDIFIDGISLAAPDFTLEKGTHQVHSSPETPAFSLLWLPRDEQHWEPRQHPAATAERL